MAAGRAEVRAVIERARERLRSGRRTVFFLDEIHRFNKAQQDALLPAVEDGLITLIGATTENPYFEVNSALISRTHLYELEALGPAADPHGCSTARWPPGHCGPPEDVDEEALEFLAERSGGDARTALNALELACEAAGPGQPRHAGPRRGRAPAPGAALRPPGRPPLRHDLGLDQGHPRLGPRRLALLPGGDARGRRGSALHRAADGDPGLRGHRQRRSAGAVGGHRGRGGGRARGAARVPVRARPGGHLPVAGAQVRRGQARGVRRARLHRASTAPPRRRAHLRSSTRSDGGYDNPHRRPGHLSARRSCCPIRRSARASTSPTTPKPRCASGWPRSGVGADVQTGRNSS